MKHFLILALITLAACNAQSREKPVGKHHAQPTALLEIYTYGLPNFDADRSRQRIAKQWGFSYRAIAGCVVDDSIINTAARHNRAVEAALNKLHGTDWKIRFEKEADAAYALDTVVRNIVFKHPPILAASASLDSQGKGLLVEPTTANDSTIDAVAYTYDEWEGRRAYVILYTLRIDTQARSTAITSRERRLFQYLD